MKPITISRHKFSGDLYKFVRKQVGVDTVVNYFFSKKISITPGLDQNNKMTIRCKEPLAVGFLIKEVL